MLSSSHGWPASKIMGLSLTHGVLFVCLFVCLFVHASFPRVQSCSQNTLEPVKRQ